MSQMNRTSSRICCKETSRGEGRTQDAVIFPSKFTAANSLQQLPSLLAQRQIPVSLQQTRAENAIARTVPRSARILWRRGRAAAGFGRPFRRLWNPRAAQTALVRAPERISCKLGAHSRFTAGRPRGSQLARSRGSGPCKVTWLCRRSAQPVACRLSPPVANVTKRGTTTSPLWCFLQPHVGITKKHRETRRG
jgi:hypothetical protein